MTTRAGDPFFWVLEVRPVWDAVKERILGGAPDGAFDLRYGLGDPVPGEWWAARVASPDGDIVGYGRLDIARGGDAEVLLAVDPARQQEGVGSFILARLDAEAAARDINYIHNTIREHPARDVVHDWLVVRGFRGAVVGDVRKRVRPRAPADVHEPRV